MVRIEGRLTPEVGAVVRRALEAACDRLSEEVREAESAGTEEVTPARRRADAIGLVAESALSAGLDPGTAGDRYQVVLHVDAEALACGAGEGRDVSAGTSTVQARTVAPVLREQTGGAPVSGQAVLEEKQGVRVTAGTSGLESPAVAAGCGDSAAVSESMTGETAGEPRVTAGTSIIQPRAVAATLPEQTGGLHVTAGTPGCGTVAPANGSRVTAGTPVSGQAVLEEGGMWVSANAARRLACDAGLVVMRHDATGAILDVGRKTRTISPALRRALAARDRHCRFPGV